MDNRTPTQDPFFGEPDDDDTTMNNDTASIRTLVAESMRSTSSNPLSIHAEPFPQFNTSYASSQDTLVAPAQSGPTTSFGTGMAYGNPQAPYLPNPLDLPNVPTNVPNSQWPFRQATWREDNDQDYWNNQCATFRFPRPTEEVRTGGHFINNRYVPADASGQSDQGILPIAAQAPLAPPEPLGYVAGTNTADYMNDDQLQDFVASTGRTSPYHFRSGPSEAPEPQVPTYALAADKVMLDTAMRFVDFLPHDPARPAMLVVVTRDDDNFVVDGLDLDQLENECPLLAIGFESNAAGIYKNSLEAKCRIIAVSFLRFLCTGSYLVTADDGVSLIAPSLLFHAEMYQLADNFDLLELKQQAQANLTRVTEFACCYPNPPEDLCEASRFIYARLGKHTNLTGIIQHYCVNCFHNHNLKDNIPFRQLVDEVPMFGLDLLKTNIERGFNDEGK